MKRRLGRFSYYFKRRELVSAASVVVTLTLAVGLNAALFSVAYSVLLRPLPFPHPDRLTLVWEFNPEANRPRSNVARLNLETWREQARSFQGLAGFREWSLVLQGPEGARKIDAALTESGLFGTLGVEPFRGRFFEPGEAGAVVVSHRLWRDVLGAAAPLSGSTLRIDGKPAAVVGVLPPDFDLRRWRAEIWAPESFDRDHERNQKNRNLRVVGRLADGVSLESALSEMDLIAAQAARTRPDLNQGWKVDLNFLSAEIAAGKGTSLWLLQGAAALVLLIGCFNLANLQIAQNLSRRREFAVRTALGAGRADLVRQKLAELFPLALLGWILGQAAAWTGICLLRRLDAQGILGLAETSIGAVPLLFAAAVAGTAWLALALGSIWLTPLHLAGSLKSNEPSPTGVRVRARRLLVVAQAALGALTLVGAGLAVRSLSNLKAVDLGLGLDGLWTARIETSGAPYSDLRRSAQFFHDLLQRLNGDGRATAALTSSLPLSGQDESCSVRTESEQGSREFEASFRSIGGSYFQLLKTPMLQGRHFAPDEAKNRSAIVNRKLAELAWPDGEAVGRTFEWGWNGEFSYPWTVIGVVGDIRHHGPRQEAQPEFFLPFERFPRAHLTLLADRPDARQAVPGLIKDTLRELDPNIPAPAIVPARELLRDHFSRPTLGAVLLVAFAALGLTLGAVGVYSVTALSAMNRRPEIAIRSALGARRDQIVRLLLKEGVVSAAVGLALGFGGAWVLARLIRGLLFGVDPWDPAVYTVCSLLSMVAVLAGCLPPALRSSRQDPAVMLRR